MTSLDADVMRRALGNEARSRLATFDAFAEIESTNTFLMEQDGPLAGQVCVAVTDNQTMGRGRHGRTWLAPAGSGLCLSLAYTFAEPPERLSALTLAVGVGVIDALEQAGVGGVQIKWPNDLIANDGKLGGILTESQPQKSGAVKVVTGVGLNVDIGRDFDLGPEADQERRVADLAGLAGTVPDRNALAAGLIDSLSAVFAGFETGGFAAYTERWSERDWLLGRELTVDTPQQQVTGKGVGIADDGALLLDVGGSVVHRITSGSVILAGFREAVE